MKEKLDSWGYQYVEVNLSLDPAQKSFMKERGHKTVPQLYYDGHHLNDIDTEQFTQKYLNEKIYPIWTQSA